MQFTCIPNQYAPLGAPALYTVESDGTTNFDIRIVGADGTLLGAKRFAALTEATFDAAPALRRTVRFSPAAGSTGFRPGSDRVVTASVTAVAEGEATGIAANAVLFAAGSDNKADSAAGTSATCPPRTFLPCRAAVSAPAIRSTMPVSRLIGSAECEELTLLTAGRTTVTVRAQTGDTVSEAAYTVEQAGLHLFRLAVGDFPGAESLTIDAGACGVVLCSVVDPPSGALRLAWRSEAGSVEHYTFPVVRSEEVAAAKQRAESPDGRIASAPYTERQVTLCSAYEPQGVLEALAGLTASPQVWIAEGNTYTPTEVLTDKAVVRRHGTMGCLEITIRSTRKTRMPWS